MNVCRKKIFYSVLKLRMNSNVWNVSRIMWSWINNVSDKTSSIVSIIFILLRTNTNNVNNVKILTTMMQLNDNVLLDKFISALSTLNMKIFVYNVPAVTISTKWMHSSRYSFNNLWWLWTLSDLRKSGNCLSNMYWYI